MMNLSKPNDNTHLNQSNQFNKLLLKTYFILQHSTYYYKYIIEPNVILIKRPTYCRELKFSYKKQQVNFRLIKALKYIKYCKRIDDMDYKTCEQWISNRIFRNKVSHLIKYITSTSNGSLESIYYQPKRFTIFPQEYLPSYSWPRNKCYFTKNTNNNPKIKNWPRADTFKLMFNGGKVMNRYSNKLIRFLVDKKGAKNIKIHLSQNYHSNKLKFSPQNLLLKYCTKIDFISENIMNQLNKWKALRKIKFKEEYVKQFSEQLDFSKATSQLQILDMSFITKDFEDESVTRLFNIRFPPNIKILKIFASCYKSQNKIQGEEYKVSNLKQNFESHVATLKNVEELSIALSGYRIQEQAFSLWSDFFISLYSSLPKTLIKLSALHYIGSKNFILPFDVAENTKLEQITLNTNLKNETIFKQLQYFNKSALKRIDLQFSYNPSNEEVLQKLVDFQNLQQISISSNAYLIFNSFQSIFDLLIQFKALQKFNSYTISLKQHQFEEEQDHKFIMELNNFYNKLLKMGCVCTLRFRYYGPPFRTYACGPLN